MKNGNPDLPDQFRTAGLFHLIKSIGAIQREGIKTMSAFLPCFIRKDTIRCHHFRNHCNVIFLILYQSQHRGFHSSVPVRIRTCGKFQKESQSVGIPGFCAVNLESQLPAGSLPGICPHSVTVRFQIDRPFPISCDPRILNGQLPAFRTDIYHRSIHGRSAGIGCRHSQIITSRHPVGFYRA